MPQRIDSLTEEQRARMPEWRDRWIAIGLRTGVSNRERFEAAIPVCYRAAGLEPPTRIVWTTSPLALALAAPTASLILAQRLSAAVRDAVGDAVDGSVGSAVDGVISQSWWRIIGGQFWVGWWYGPASVSFYTDVCGLELSPDMMERARAYRETCESACWWWPHREFVMVCERPMWIDRDERGRLHSPTRAAICWPDGWGLHMWHGVRVPAHVIEAPASITVAEIEAEQNAEVRRVMIERYGAARYLLDSGAKPVSRTKVRRSLPQGSHGRRADRHGAPAQLHPGTRR